MDRNARRDGSLDSPHEAAPPAPGRSTPTAKLAPRLRADAAPPGEHLPSGAREVALDARAPALVDAPAAAGSIDRDVAALSGLAGAPLFCKLEVGAAPTHAPAFPSSLSFRPFPDEIVALATPMIGVAAGRARWAEGEYARSLGARAATWRDRVVFAPGQADFKGRDGMHLALHELAHVGQADTAAAPGPDGTLPVDHDAGRERAADDAADRALTGATPRPVGDGLRGVALKILLGPEKNEREIKIKETKQILAQQGATKEQIKTASTAISNAVKRGTHRFTDEAALYRHFIGDQGAQPSGDGGPPSPGNMATSSSSADPDALLVITSDVDPGGDDPFTSEALESGEEGAEHGREMMARRLLHRIAIADRVCALCAKTTELRVYHAVGNPNITVEFRFNDFGKIKNKTSLKQVIPLLRVWIAAQLGIATASTALPVAASMRQSFGFNETSTADTALSFRVAPGNEPRSYADLIAAQILRLDAALNQQRTAHPDDYLRRLGVYTKPGGALDASRRPLKGLDRGDKSQKAYRGAIATSSRNPKDGFERWLDQMSPADYVGKKEKKAAKDDDEQDDEQDHSDDEGDGAADQVATTSSGDTKMIVDEVPDAPTTLQAIYLHAAAKQGLGAFAKPAQPARIPRVKPLITPHREVDPVVDALARDLEMAEETKDEGAWRTGIYSSTALALHRSHIASFDPTDEPAGPLGSREVAPGDVKNSQYYWRSNTAGDPPAFKIYKNLMEASGEPLGGKKRPKGEAGPKLGGQMLPPYNPRIYDAVTPLKGVNVVPGKTETDPWRRGPGPKHTEPHAAAAGLRRPAQVAVATAMTRLGLQDPRYHATAFGVAEEGGGKKRRLPQGGPPAADKRARTGPAPVVDPAPVRARLEELAGALDQQLTALVGPASVNGMNAALGAAALALGRIDPDQLRRPNTANELTRLLSGHLDAIVVALKQAEGHANGNQEALAYHVHRILRDGAESVMAVAHLLDVAERDIGDGEETFAQTRRFRPDELAIDYEGVADDEEEASFTDEDSAYDDETGSEGADGEQDEPIAKRLRPPSEPWQAQAGMNPFPAEPGADWVGDALHSEDLDARIVGWQSFLGAPWSHEQRLAMYWARRLGHTTPITAGRTESGMQSFSAVLAAIAAERKKVHVVADPSFNYFELNTLLPAMSFGTPSGALNKPAASAALMNPAPNVAGWPDRNAKRWTYGELLKEIDRGLPDIVIDITDVPKDDRRLVEFVREASRRSNETRITLVDSGAKHRQGGHDIYNFGEVVVVGAALAKLQTLFSTDPLSSSLLDMIDYGNARASVAADRHGARRSRKAPSNGDVEMGTQTASGSRDKGKEKGDPTDSQQPQRPRMPPSQVREEKLPGDLAVLVTKTIGDGNCLIHAMCGTPNHEGKFYCADAGKRRTDLAARIRCGVTQGHPQLFVELLGVAIANKPQNYNEALFTAKFAESAIANTIRIQSILATIQAGRAAGAREDAVTAIVALVQAGAQQDAGDEALLARAIMTSVVPGGAVPVEPELIRWYASDNLGDFQPCIPAAYDAFLRARAETGSLAELVETHFAALIEIYATCVESGSGFYLYDADAELLAELHPELSVRMLSPHAILDESVVHGRGGTAVDIFHRGAHYERAQMRRQ